MSGVIKGIYRHERASAVGFYGILKKLMIFLVVSAAFMIQRVITAQLPIRDITVLFYISNESISLVENAAEFIPIPHKLKAVLQEFKKDEEEKE